MTLVTVGLINKKIKKISVLGHAGSDDYGKDIVCSSISTAVIMSANLLLSVDSSNIVKSDEKKALIELEISNNSKNIEFSYLILDNLYKTFVDLQSQYPKYLKIKFLKEEELSC